jgi:hypothetical protein
MGCADVCLEWASERVVDGVPRSEVGVGWVTGCWVANGRKLGVRVTFSLAGDGDGLGLTMRAGGEVSDAVRAVGGR